VNNAGIQRRAPFLDFALSDWNDLLATNLSAAFLLSQRVGRGMVDRGSGKIINIGSVHSLLARPTITPCTCPQPESKPTPSRRATSLPSSLKPSSMTNRSPSGGRRGCRQAAGVKYTHNGGHGVF